MYLKKITASGFKSFADKVSISFRKNQISGIIGPNGSGKSNVIDAVRWVMGEQNTKMLRGEKATDIIFAGSQKRKALGMAEVTLTFDNSNPSEFCPPEFRHEQEISLTRRIYIDGQREFLLGGRQCRLKDIVNFFSSSGLGGRSYSMIQQGQVERILQAKPEEIREILEEAAGTGIFKIRRQESRTKLEQTQGNLSRIADILAEVNRQMDSLQQQVRAAERWQELSARLRQDEIKLFTHNFAHFKENEQQMTETISTAIAEEQQHGASIVQLEEAYRATKAKLDAADPQLQQLMEVITQVREEIASLEAALASSEQLKESTELQLVNLDVEMREEEAAYHQAQGQHGGVEETLNALEAEVSSLATLVAERQERLDLLDEERIVFQNRVEELVDEHDAIEKSLTRNQMQRESVQRDFSKLSRQKSDFGTQLEDFENEFSQARILADSYQVQLQQQQGGLDQELAVKNTLERSIVGVSSQLVQLDQALSQSNEDLITLKAQRAAHSADENSAGEGIALWRKCEELLGSSAKSYTYLADVLAFAPGFSRLPTPLVAACEQWLERVICPDWSHLQELSQQLSSQAWGGLGAGVYAEDSLSEVKSWAKKLGLTPLQPLFKSEGALDLSPILGRLFAAEQHQDLEKLATTLPPQVVVFTWAGDTLLGKDDIIVSTRARDGLLTRKQKFAQLSEDLTAAAEVHRVNLASQQEAQASLAEMREDLKKVDEKINLVNKDLVKILAAHHAAQHKVDLKKDQLIAARLEVQKITKQCDAYATELSELAAQKVQLSEQQQHVEIAREEAEQEAQQLNDEYQDVKRQWEQQKLQWAAVNAKAQTVREHAEQDRQKLANFEQRVARKREQGKVLLEKLEQLADQRAQRETEIKVCIERREEKEALLNEKREANAGLVDEVRGLENGLKTTRAAMQVAQKLGASKEVEIARVKMAMSAICEQAQEKYSLDVTTYECTLDPTFDAAKQSRDIGVLRGKITDLGEVNMVAVKEFKELQERDQFMQQQKAEIESAVALLEQGILEIEENSKEKFLGTFVKINEEFQGLFPILFPLGEAKLQLTDENNPLESGVEIMVQLPGKKTQSMRLFSGGEKALTAIALIFALLKSKPTPFCFLDEVDAPLDEKNIGRYNKVITALADRFQFIVITHRRPTMEAFDVLYGITMQEPGVSKVVGVDLNQALPHHLQKAFQLQAEPLRQGASST